KRLSLAGSVPGGGFSCAVAGATPKPIKAPKIRTAAAKRLPRIRCSIRGLHQVFEARLTRCSWRGLTLRGNGTRIKPPQARNMTAARQERKLCRGFATIAAVMGLLAALAGPVAFAAATTERVVVNRHT